MTFWCKGKSKAAEKLVAFVYSAVSFNAVVLT